MNVPLESKYWCLENNLSQKDLRVTSCHRRHSATFSISQSLGKPASHWGQDGPSVAARTPTPTPPRTPAGTAEHRRTR